MSSTIISANLKRLQKLKELTITQLAEKSGVSVRTIERIRSGKHVPDLDTIKKLAKALGQKPEHLVEGAIKKQEISAGIALSINSKNIERVFKKAHKKLKALDLKLDKTHAKAVERAELPVGTIKDRKDFTKFERGLDGKKTKCFWCGKPTDDKYKITMYAWGMTNVFFTCQECEDNAKKDREKLAALRAEEIRSIKLRIITAACLAVITLFIAFYFAL